MFEQTVCTRMMCTGAGAGLCSVVTLRAVYYDRSIASVKMSPPHSASYCFLFQLSVCSFFLNFSSCLCLFPCLPVTSNPPDIFP
jgi:hypothetical protein